MTQRHQLSTILHFTIKEFFETPDTYDADMSTAHYNIFPIVNRSFRNNFQNHNGPNQRPHVHKIQFNSINPDDIKEQEDQLYHI